MIGKSFFSRAACLLGLLGANLPLHGGGFQVNLQGVSQVGMGHTGAGLAIDPSAQLFNPGGFAMAKGGVSLSFMPIFGRVSYTEPSPGTYQTSNEATMATPFSAYGGGCIKISEGHRLGFGLAAYTPFGSRIVYADDWKGQFALREISVKAIFTQATVSYAYKDIFGIGGSFVYATGDVSVRKALPVQFPDGTYGEAVLKGAAGGLGFTAGVYFKPHEKLSIGLNYRSKVTFEASSGQAEFTVPSDLSSFFPNTTFSSALPMPATTTLGLAYRYGGEDDVVCLDVNHVGWSAYQALAFDFAENTEKLEDSYSPRNYHNSMIYRVGWQGRMNEKLLLRAGFTVDMTPVPDGYLTPETPDAVKFGTSVGASYSLGPVRIDGAFMWVEGMKRTDINQETNFGGTFKARAFIPCIGVSWLPDFLNE
jgi:long-chain fatty acid transport protein